MERLRIEARANGSRRTTRRGTPVPRRTRGRRLVLESLEQKTLLSTINWTGAGDGTNWSDVKNWDSPTLPGAGDDVIINVEANPTIKITSGSVSIRSLTSAESLALSGGTLTLSAASSINAPFQFSSGTLNAGPGLALSDASTWTGGTLGGSVTSTGTLTVSNSGDKYLSGTLTNAGTMTIAAGAGPIRANASGATVANQAGATLDIQTDGTAFNTYAASGALTNAGTLRKSAGVGASGIGFALANTGTVEAQTGMISATGGGTIGGDFAVIAGTLSLDGGTFTVQPGASKSGAGTLRLGGGTLSLGSGQNAANLSVTNFVMASGTVSGPGTLTASGANAWTGGVLGNLTSTGTLGVSGGSDKYLSGTLTNAGTMTIAAGAGPIRANASGATVANQAGATLDIQTDGTAFNTYAASGALTNAGTLRKSAGAGASGIGFALANTGTVEVQVGTLRPTAGGSSVGGVFIVSKDATYDLTGGTTFTLSGEQTGSGGGVVTLSSGTLNTAAGGTTFNFPAGLLQWTGGYLAGSVTNAGAFTVSKPGDKLLTGTLTNAATLTIAADAGSIRSYAVGAGVVNQAGATLDIQSDGQAFIIQSGGGTLTNAGTIRKSAGAGTSTVSFAFANNGGTIEVLSGTLRLPSLSGSVSGTTLTGGTYLVRGVLGVEGLDVRENAATVVLEGAGAKIVDTKRSDANALGSLGTIAAGGSLAVREGAGLSVSGSLTNAGELIVGAGSTLGVAGGFSQGDGGTLNFELGGTPESGAFGKIAVGGATALDGALNVSLVDGFEPVIGQTFRVMTFASPTGEFNEDNGGQSPRYEARLSAQALDVVFVETATATVVQSSKSPSTYGDSVTFTATVTALAQDPGTPTGTVQFHINGAAFGPAIQLVNGVATSPVIAGLKVGSYVVSASYSGDSIHATSEGETTQTVGKAALTVKADDKTRGYGQVNPALTASYSGFVLGEGPGVLGGSLVLSTSATASSGVGAHAITAGGLTSDNYDITFVNGNLSITPASLTITADDQTKVYGQANPALTASYSGFVNGDGPSSLGGSLNFTTNATAASGVGQYAINVSGETSANYAIQFVSGTLNVTPASLTITANDQARLYGQANPALTASYSGFVNGDGPGSLASPVILSTSATAASPVGSYPITASGASSPNYNITFVNGNLSVGKAHLTVSAHDARRARYAANPTFGYSISGFVNGEDASVVSGAPALATSATADSPAGVYPITATLGSLAADNYDFSAFENGTLSVSPVVTDVRVHWGSRSASILPQNLGGRLTLPWGNITGVEVIFSDNVVVDQNAMTLTGDSGAAYSFSGFQYNSATRGATWTLPTALGVDLLMMALDGEGDPGGVHVEPGVFMDAYDLGFAVLPGDFNGDGVVDSLDSVGIRNQILGNGNTELAIFADLDGDGTVDLTDYNTARRWLGKSLPRR